MKGHCFRNEKRTRRVRVPKRRTSTRPAREGLKLIQAWAASRSSRSAGMRVRKKEMRGRALSSRLPRR